MYSARETCKSPRVLWRLLLSGRSVWLICSMHVGLMVCWDDPGRWRRAGGLVFPGLLQTANLVAGPGDTRQLLDPVRPRVICRGNSPPVSYP